MKTIEITDEMHAALMAISEEMNSQDHRYTRMPYMFQVMSTTRDLCVEGSGEEVWIDDEGVEIGSEEELIKHIAEISNEEYEGRDEEAIDYAENTGYRLLNLQDGKQYQNFFFTESACREHIRKNNYHYSEPKDYLTGAFRNPELELVQKFLCELSGGKLHE